MTISALTWFTIGACIVYMVAVDANVYPWLVLQTKRLGVEVRRLWYLARHNPDSPWVRYEVERNAKKMAEDLLKEYENK
jgi:hypothetical protein